MSKRYMNVYLPDVVIRELKFASAINGRSVSGLIEDATKPLRESAMAKIICTAPAHTATSGVQVTNVVATTTLATTPNPRKSSLSKGAIMRKDWTSPSDWQASPEAVKYASRKRIRSCAKCGGSRDVPGQRYCRRCRAAYMREHRAKRKQTHITISRMEYEALRNRST